MLRIFVLILAVLAWAGRAQADEPSPMRVPFPVTGTIHDFESGKPLAGVQVWFSTESYGTVSDARGRFEIVLAPFMFASTLNLRLCEGLPEISVRVERKRRGDGEFAEALQLDLELLPKRECWPPQRVPWRVDPRDAIEYAGHMRYSWEGGGSFQTCDGRIFGPVWPPGFDRASIWTRTPREGEPRFMRLLAREDLFERLMFPQPLWVGRVLEIGPPREQICPFD